LTNQLGIVDERHQQTNDVRFQIPVVRGVISKIFEQKYFLSPTNRLICPQAQDAAKISFNHQTKTKKNRTNTKRRTFASAPRSSSVLRDQSSNPSIHNQTTRANTPTNKNKKCIRYFINKTKRSVAYQTIPDRTDEGTARKRGDREALLLLRCHALQRPLIVVLSFRNQNE
jgi:hypothetical protein